MLSYNYLTHKFCIQEGYDHLAPFFSVPKGASNLKKLEGIFQQICERLDWEYTPYDQERVTID
jgi:hypothetical protein